jgi:hypothetical protein
MTVPSQMSLRRMPPALHLPVRVAYAGAWEALTYTQTSQALQFLYEFSSRVAPLDALDLYFSVVAVPLPMQEVVRTRTLTSLEPETLPPLTPMPVLTGWNRLRLDLVLEHQRYRRRFHERTIKLAKMVGARAAEAVVATHVENGIGLIRLLQGVFTVEEITELYVREFSLPSNVGQMVWQRVQARVAGEQLTAQYDEPPPVLEREPEILPDLSVAVPRSAIDARPARSQELPAELADHEREPDHPPPLVAREAVLGRGVEIVEPGTAGADHEFPDALRQVL